MATPTVYVICDQNCKFEGMTKEQILAAIAQAVSTGEIKDVDAGFVQTIKTINGVPLKFFVGEQSVYDELTEDQKKDLFAIITNDTAKEGLLDAINTLRTDFDEVMEGTRAVPKATDATNASLLKCGAPVLNTAKKLTDGAGYYYLMIVDNYNGLSYEYGVFYWGGDGTKAFVQPYVSFASNTAMELLYVKIDTDGSIIWDKVHNTSGTIAVEERTARGDFYTKKIGE